MSARTRSLIVFLAGFLAAAGCPLAKARDERSAAGLDRSLLAYRQVLEPYRRASQVRALPPRRFFLFGMGDRRKLVYSSGELKDARTGEVLHRWDVARDWILPHEYRVVMDTRQGARVSIVEDDGAVWIVRGTEREPVARSGKVLRLPSFADHPQGSVLRVLHHEVLINIVDGKPVPNLFVYPRPWYRDGAMMAMVLKRTGNLDLITEWVLGLREPFDRNNAGEREADNPGEVLYLISLVSDRAHPLVAECVHQLEGLSQDGQIGGRTDFGSHPVYQTRWASLGLKALGLPSPYRPMEVQDSYAGLCWWDPERPAASGGKPEISMDYPYLTWAQAHFQGQAIGPVGDQDYPLSWESNASQAHYAGMAALGAVYQQQKLCVPHTWHAAEMFLAIDGLWVRVDGKEDP